MKQPEGRSTIDDSTAATLFPKVQWNSRGTGSFKKRGKRNERNGTPVPDLK